MSQNNTSQKSSAEKPNKKKAFDNWIRHALAKWCGITSEIEQDRVAPRLLSTCVFPCLAFMELIVYFRFFYMFN
jgi:hypothetical protein